MLFSILPWERSQNTSNLQIGQEKEKKGNNRLGWEQLMG
jgi:hypothetical protein